MLYTVYFILQTIYYILYTVYCMVHTMYYTLYTTYCLLYTIYYILCTMYYMLYTIYHILHTVDYILYTLYFLLCILFPEAQAQTNPATDLVEGRFAKAVRLVPIGACKTKRRMPSEAT